MTFKPIKIPDVPQVPLTWANAQVQAMSGELRAAATNKDPNVVPEILKKIKAKLEEVAVNEKYDRFSPINLKRYCYEERAESAHALQIEYPNRIQVLPGDQVLVSHDSLIKLFTLSNGSCEANGTIRAQAGQSDFKIDFQFLGDAYAATLQSDGKTHLWKRDSEEQLRRLKFENSNPHGAIHLCPDRKLYCAEKSGSCITYDFHNKLQNELAAMGSSKSGLVSIQGLPSGSAITVSATGQVRYATKSMFHSQDIAVGSHCLAFPSADVLISHNNDISLYKYKSLGKFEKVEICGRVNDAFVGFQTVADGRFFSATAHQIKIWEKDDRGKYHSKLLIETKFPISCFRALEDGRIFLVRPDGEMQIFLGEED